MRAAAVAAAVAGSLGLAAALGSGEAVVDGQVLFVPTARPMLGSGADAGLLQIRSCDRAAEGLRVSGTVAAEGHVVTIMVSAPEATGAGVRVGKGLAAHINLANDSEVGDFQVILPWADETALFSVAGAPVPSRSATAGTPAVGCPDPS